MRRSFDICGDNSNGSIDPFDCDFKNGNTFKEGEIEVDDVDVVDVRGKRIEGESEREEE